MCNQRTYSYKVAVDIDFFPVILLSFVIRCSFFWNLYYIRFLLKRS